MKQTQPERSSENWYSCNWQYNLCSNILKLAEKTLLRNLNKMKCLLVENVEEYLYLFSQKRKTTAPITEENELSKNIRNHVNNISYMLPILQISSNKQM